MPSDQHILAPPNEQMRTELRVLARDCLFDAKASDIEGLRRLRLFGGSNEEPVALPTFHRTFCAFLKTNEELAGAMCEMAIRLFGAEEPYRSQTLEGRLKSVGEVEWRERKKVSAEAVARRKSGRRDKVLDRVALAIVIAEPAAFDQADTAGSNLTASSEEEHPETRLGRFISLASYKRPWIIAIGAVGASLLVSAAVVAHYAFQLGLKWRELTSARHQKTPPAGTIIDAATGKILSKRHLALPHQQVKLDTRDLVLACDQTTGTCASSTVKLPLRVRYGDKLRFTVKLHNTSHETLTRLKVYVSTTKTSVGHLVSVVLTWYSAGRRSGRVRGTRLTVRLPVEPYSPVDSVIRFYGDTTFLYEEGARDPLARLPNVYEGVNLTDLRGSTSCYISFEMVVYAAS